MNSDLFQCRLQALSQTAVGCGIGLLLAGKLGRPAQKATAVTLLSVASIFVVKVSVETVVARLNGPGSARGEQRRLDSIRAGDGYSNEVEVF